MSTEMMHVVLLTMLFFATCETLAQDAIKSVGSTQKGSVQMVATSNAFYLEREIKSNINALFSVVFLYGIIDAPELRRGLDFREEGILENEMEQRNKLSGYSPLMFGPGYDPFPGKDILRQLTLTGDIFMPFTAARDFRPSSTAEAVREVFTHTLSRKCYLLYNTGVILGVPQEQDFQVCTLLYQFNPEVWILF